ncbi:MAG: hypothetical protein ABIQ33_09010 [Caldimonas sp.]
MFAFIKPLRAGALGLGAAAVGLAVSLPATAQSNPGVSSAEAVAETFVADAQIVVKDGDTGRLRHATADEAKALHDGRAHARGRVAASPASRSHWSGARGARLTDEFMSYSVVVKRADGALVELCVEGGETTARLVTSASLKPATLPTE